MKDYQLDKVERLYSQYKEAVAEMEKALALFTEVKTKLSGAMAQAALARDNYNQALAEYSYQLKSHAIQRNKD